MAQPAKRERLSRSELREQLSDGLTGLTHLAFGGVGSYRANRWRKVAPELAKGIAGIWTIQDEHAIAIADPLAGVISEYIPDAWLANVVQGVQPLAAVGAIASVVYAMMEAEKALIAVHQQAFLDSQAAMNGHPAEPMTPDMAGVIADHPQAE